MRRRAPLLALACAAALAAVSGCKKEAPPPAAPPAPTVVPTPVDDSVAFIRSGALWVIHSDGKAERRLASPGANELFWFPSPAPGDRGFLVWVSRGDGTQDLARIDPDGSLHRLTDLGEPARPEMKNLSIGNAASASPDGKQIAYSFNGDLWVMNADGTDAQTLIHDGASWAPSWSPDGRQIAYVNGKDHLDLWIADVASQDTYQATDFTDFTLGSPRWSPSGDKILVTRTRGEDNDVAVVDAKVDSPAADVDILLTKDHLSSSGVYNFASGNVIFSSSQAGGDRWDLYASDPSGSAVRRLTTDGGLSPCWSAQRLDAPAPAPSPTPARPVRVPTAAPTEAPSPVPAATPAATPQRSPTPAPRTAASPVAGTTPAAAALTPLRLRLSAGFDAQNHPDAATLADLALLDPKIRKRPHAEITVVGPLDLSGGSTADDAAAQARSLARAQSVATELAHETGAPADRVHAQPYSPPAIGGSGDKITVYVELR